MVQNKALIFSKPPTTFPVPGEHITIEDRPLDIDTTELPKDGLLTKQIYASLDPYLRGKLRLPSTKYYAQPFDLHGPLSNNCIAKVIKSANPKFNPGDLVVGMLPIAEYSVVPAAQAAGLRPLENPYKLDTSVYVGALGMPGLTAYSSLYAIGKPKKGETIFVSAASGAVGQIVGQIAKHEGLTVIGSVGSDEKLDFIVKNLGFDGGFNYKKEKPSEALQRLAPKGVDIYYDNVGGEQLEAALEAMADWGRIGEYSQAGRVVVVRRWANDNEVSCGMITGYNQKPEERYGVKNLFHVIGKRLTIQGFIVSDANMGPKYGKEFNENMAKWIHDGSFKVKEDVTVGIDNAATAFVGMLEGKNFGKAVLKIADLD
ncbi:hypothetical protein MMC26_000453 [Xylographa opegraphella]|nr:hypothetical protein [Xylographa opegraphella]